MTDGLTMLILLTMGAVVCSVTIYVMTRKK